MAARSGGRSRRERRRASAAGRPHALVGAPPETGPPLGDGPGRRLAPGPLGPAGGGRRSRAGAAVPAQPLPYAADPGGGAAGQADRDERVRPGPGPVSRTGPDRARPLRRAVADSRPPAARRGPPRAVAGRRRAPALRGGARIRAPGRRPRPVRDHAAARRPLPRRAARPDTAALPAAGRPGAQSRTGPHRGADARATGRRSPPESVLAWAARRRPPLPCRAARPAARRRRRCGRAVWSWAEELLRVQLRGARGGERPRLPGGRRPYVRAPIPPRPDGLRYDAAEEALLLGEGRVSPVPVGAWDFKVGGVRMLELWFERRTAAGGRGWLRWGRAAGRRSGPRSCWN